MDGSHSPPPRKAQRHRLSVRTSNADSEAESMAAAVAALPDSRCEPSQSGSSQLHQPLIGPFGAVASEADQSSLAQQQQHVLLRTAYGGFSVPEESAKGQITGQPPPPSRASFAAGKNPLWMDSSGSILAIPIDSQLGDVPAAAGFRVPPPAARKMPLGAVKQNSVLPLDGDVPLRMKPERSIFENSATLAALPVWKQRSLVILNSISYLVFSTFVTVIAIFLSDIRLAVTPRSADKFFTVLASLCLVQFAVELVWTAAVKPKYFLGFWFWLDLISTASLLLDIPAVQSSFISAGSSREDKQASTLRAAVRAFQLIRISRLLKVLQIVQLLKARREQRRVEELRMLSDDNGGDYYDPVAEEKQPSRVGQKLSDLTTSRVVLLVLAMLFVLPVFNIGSGIYGTAPSLGSSGVKVLHQLWIQEGYTSPAFLTAATVAFPSAAVAAEQLILQDSLYILGLGAAGSHETFRPLILKICNSTFLPATDAALAAEEVRIQQHWRPDELTREIIKTPGCNNPSQGQCLISTGVFDLKWESQLQAVLDMLRIITAIILLGLGAYIFKRDTTVLVLVPIERMFKKVKLVSLHPLAKHARVKAKKEEEQLETRQLENALDKICSLLAVGFGDAGAEVIANNIKSGGDIDPMIPGQKVTAIFGFCDIRQFTDTTEVLQEDIMEFVNSIAKIVHSEVDKHGGAANKNIGDAFLLVWKFPSPAKMAATRARIGSGGSGGSPGSSHNSSFSIAQRNGSSSLGRPKSRSLGRKTNLSQRVLRKHSVKVSREGSVSGAAGRPPPLRGEELADRALAAFIVIQALLKLSPRLKQFCKRADLNARMPDYTVRMGFGLHVGWAIEGAIGSEHKIDASYLSPNVNMASRLEAATKQFGTTILLSDDFVSLLSPAVRRRVRQVDCVTVKGSNQPMGLFTYDVTLERIASPSDAPGAEMADPDTFSSSVYEHEFDEHPHLVKTWAVGDAFLERFREGFRAYQSGRWGTARAVLEECATARRTHGGEVVPDGPSITLLEFMARTGYVVPEDWQGCRELTDK